MHRQFLEAHNINDVIKPLLEKLLIEKLSQPAEFIIHNLCIEYPDQAKIAVASLEKVKNIY